MAYPSEPLMLVLDIGQRKSDELEWLRSAKPRFRHLEGAGFVQADQDSGTFGGHAGRFHLRAVDE